MLSIKIRKSDACETIIEAEMARYEPRRPLPDISETAISPAVLCVFGQVGASQSPVYYTEGTIWVMNDKGRTIATYYPDIDNAVAEAGEIAVRPAPPHPPQPA